MFRKISDWYMEQKISHLLLVAYLAAATSATLIIPGREGLILWAWGTATTLIVGPWMWSLNHVTKKHTGNNLWGNDG
jgi:hypothetical protein